jgi:ABC-type sugar transport system ATPase subunit
MSEAPPPAAIRAEHLAKRFGAVTALVDVSMRLEQGEVLGLVGDNGAGKSTLIKILSGFHQPDEGRLEVNGEDVQLRSVMDARARGIDTVYQDLALVPTMSVYHNMFLRREILWRPLALLPLLNNRAMKKRAREYLDAIGVRIPFVESEVALLSGGQRQAIAIARSVYSGARVLLLDEPLAAMGVREGKLILDLIEQLKQRSDVSMIVVAHNYTHIFEVCDRVNLLQHGRITFDRPTAQTSIEELTEVVVSEFRATG